MVSLFLLLGLRRGSQGTASNSVLVIGVAAVVTVWLTQLR